MAPILSFVSLLIFLHSSFSEKTVHRIDAEKEGGLL